MRVPGIAAAIVAALLTLTLSPAVASADGGGTGSTDRVRVSASPIPPPSVCTTHSVLSGDKTRAQRRARTKRCVQGDHMSDNAYNCLITAISTSFGVGVGGLIVRITAKQIAGAVVGGSAAGCLQAVLGR
jgi:hypothetical protein